MTVYPRTAARAGQAVKLNRNFYNDATLYDPYLIEKIEIWQNRFDPEFEVKYPGVLRKDIRFGSRINYYDIDNNCLDTLGLAATLQQTTGIQVYEYEYEFFSETSVTIAHNLNDRYPAVTVYNNAGDVVIPNTVHSVDANTLEVDFGTSMSGIVDILGANEADLGVSNVSTLAKRYIQAFTNTSTVVVTHNLNDDTPLVYIYDSNYNQVFYSSIQIQDANTILIEFGVPMTGEVVVMGGVQGQAEVGFGCQAVVYGTKAQTYNVTTNENKLLIKVGTTGTDQTITLLSNCAAQVSDIITTINSQLVDAQAYVSSQDPNKIMIKSNEWGANAFIEIKAIANSAYNLLGIAIGVYRGLGYAPAVSIGSKNGTYPVTAADNTLLLNFGAAGYKTVTLGIGNLSASAIVNELNTSLNAQYATSGVIYAEVTVAREIKLKAVGGSVEIAITPNDAYDNLGFAVGTYLADVTSTIAEYFVIDSTNDALKFVVNYAYDPVTLSLTQGNRSAAQIVAEIQAKIVLLNLADIVVAEVTSGALGGGRVIIRALVNDGILRSALGQYYVDYDVPTSFLVNGVLFNKFLDVWDYAPTMSYHGGTIYDDTDSFIVYADNYFLDSGYQDYSFSFTLLNDQFMMGEKRYISCQVLPLPKYKTPVITEWILPMATAQYRVVTQSDTEIIAWTNCDVNTGRTLKAWIDTANSIWREGVYKIYFKISLPESSIIISNSNKFTVTAR